MGGKKGFYVLIPQKIPMEVGEKKTDGEMERERGRSSKTSLSLM